MPLSCVVRDTSKAYHSSRRLSLLESAAIRNIIPCAYQEEIFQEAWHGNTVSSPPSMPGHSVGTSEAGADQTRLRTYSANTKRVLERPSVFAPVKRRNLIDLSRLKLLMTVRERSNRVLL
jgi:hypothetical protein